MQVYFGNVGSLSEKKYIFTYAKKDIIYCVYTDPVGLSTIQAISCRNSTLRQLCYNALFTDRFKSYLLFSLICISQLLFKSK